MGAPKVPTIPAGLAVPAAPPEAPARLLVQRTRTPPDVKWLLNERAALAGEVSKAEVTQAGLLAKQARLERQLAGVQALLARSLVAQSRTQASIDALDATLALAHSRVEPTAGGTVDAWAGKYGKRGGLGEFIAQSLREVAPASLTTSVLMDLAARHFGLAFPLQADRRSFNKSVNSSLTWLRKRGQAEPLHSRELGSHGVWRWKAQMPTLEALQARAAAAVAHERTRDVAGEMAGEGTGKVAKDEEGAPTWR